MCRTRVFAISCALAVAASGCGAPPPASSTAALTSASEPPLVTSLSTPSCADVNGAIAYLQYGVTLPPVLDSDLTVVPPALDAPSFYATADQLMPVYGVIPVGAYGTPPLGANAAFGNGRFTWVVNLPPAADGSDATYQVWIRSATGWTRATVDDQQLDGIATTNPNAPGTFYWTLVGSITPGAGTHYVDVDLSYNAIFDAILFTRDASYQPNAQPPPASWRVPSAQTTSQRAYRAQQYAVQPLTIAGGPTTNGESMAWLITSPRRQYDVDIDDWNRPQQMWSNRLLPFPLYYPFTLSLWGAANQYINGSFELVAGERGAEVQVAASDLVGPDGATIAASDVDVRVAKSYPYQVAAPSGLVTRELAKPLLHDDRGQPDDAIIGDQGAPSNVAYSRMAASNNRLFWVTAHARAGAPPGQYTGQLTITDTRLPCMQMTVPVQLELAQIDLEPVTGAEGIMYLDHVAFENGASDDTAVSLDQYRAELADLAAHGLNSVSSYSGVAWPQSQVVPADEIAAAGLTNTVIDMIDPENGVPGESPPTLAVDYAHQKGISEVVFWTVDEPHVFCGSPGCQCANVTLPRGCPSSVPTESSEPCTWSIDQTLYYLCDRLPWNIHSTVTVPALETFDSIIGGADGYDPYVPMGLGADRPIMGFYLFDRQHIAAVRNQGGLPYSYIQYNAIAAPDFLRAQGGLFNRGLGYQGKFQWAYRQTGPAAIFAADLSTAVAAMTYPDQNGLPIPTRHWEAHRAAIDDIRYVQALQRALDAGHAEVAAGTASPTLATLVANAQGWMDQSYNQLTVPYADSIWYYIMAVDETTLDAKRHQAVEWTTQIDQNL